MSCRKGSFPRHQRRVGRNTPLVSPRVSARIYPQSSPAQSRSPFRSSLPSPNKTTPVIIALNPIYCIRDKKESHIASAQRKKKKKLPKEPVFILFVPLHSPTNNPKCAKRKKEISFTPRRAHGDDGWWSATRRRRQCCNKQNPVSYNPRLGRRMVDIAKARKGATGNKSQK
jgi:hypothetical protein